MEKLYLIVFTFLFGVNILICNAFYTDEDEIDTDEAVEFYNSIPGLTWKAGRNGLKKKVKILELKSKLGWIPKENEKVVEYKGYLRDQESDLPKSYDCRIAYPQCTTISSIKDQSDCGSCWAVSTAAVFSDRLCIHSNGTHNLNMSAQQLLECDKESFGCDGGFLDTAWKYIANNGLVTGGDYGSNEGCWPYSIPPKKSQQSSSSKQIFSASSSKNFDCKNVTCPDWFKAKNDNFTSMEPDEDVIRKEIFKNGPVVAGLQVPLSFKFYEEGIYCKPFFDLFSLGGHAVRVIGWGEEYGIKYWIVANSWGRKWGENGTFRICRGINNCGFERNIYAGLPQLSSN